jgi:hypothetical protein
MKEYNRKTKRWEEEKPVGSLKKLETCKGKKPHEFVLLIPNHVYRDHLLSKDEIEKYYEIEEKRKIAQEFFDLEQNKIGVRCNRHWSYHNPRFYKCAICGKEKYE